MPGVAAVLCVKDIAGRWTCIGFEYDRLVHHFERSYDTHFIEPDTMPARVKEELVLVHNPSQSRAQRVEASDMFSLDFESHDFDLVHWQAPGSDNVGSFSDQEQANALVMTRSRYRHSWRAPSYLYLRRMTNRPSS